ncbi:MAG: threonine synthase [Coriobacteriia bacterium]|nr:threonine synthase [Coriobacteriia bacterium]
MNFTDTRTGTPHNLRFSDMLVKGIAPSGGLFVPCEITPLDDDALQQLATVHYADAATAVFQHFGIDFDEATVRATMQEAYGAQWASTEITPLVTLDDHTTILELFEGPTSAFKDVALQCMPRFMSLALEKHRREDVLEHDLLILVATSGDTGKAALEGFADRDATNIIVFYPEDGVSDLQKRQMQTQVGANVAVYGVRGNFDDCQNAVKSVFADATFNEWLHTEANLQLSSANSINWGRLLPQVTYYVRAAMQSAAMQRGPVDICVPTGNFGNILAAYYAKLLGAPIGQLICASNANHVLTDFLQTGVYDISKRTFYTTSSPSMDILISSNLERLLFHLAGAEAVRDWMTALAAHGRFEVDGATRAALQSEFAAAWVDEATTLATIKRCWDEHRYLLDPHTAVALAAANALRHHESSSSAPANPLLVVSTAHWAKFAPSVVRALTETAPNAPLPSPYDAHTDLEMLDDVLALAPGCRPIPAPLAALRDATPRFTDVIDADAQSIQCVTKRLSQGDGRRHQTG